MNNKLYTIALALGTILGFGGCNDNEFQQAAVTFAPTFRVSVIEPEAGQASFPQVVKMRFSSPLTEESRIVLRVDAGDAQYGVNYTSNPPEVLRGEIAINAQPGQTEAEFTYTLIGDGVYTDGYQITYSVKSYSGGVNSKIKDVFNISVVERDFPPIIYVNNFNDCTTDFVTPAGFIEAFVDGSKTDRGWGCRGFGNGPSRGVQASAFGGEAGTDDAWLIMPAVNANEYNILVLKFWLESFFSGSGLVKVYWSNNYKRAYTEAEINANPRYYNDPLANGTWTEIKSINDKMPDAGSRDPKFYSGKLEGVSGENVSIAFRYFGASNASASSWTIDDLSLHGQ